jgi:hypothetical protein
LIGISNSFSSFSQCRVHANIGARRFFGRSLTRIARQNRNFSVATLFARDGTPATPVNENCTESRGGDGRFAKRRTTGPYRNGHDCLNAATVLIATTGRAVTLAAAEIACFVGWVERSETHHCPGHQLMGIAAPHPSYKSTTLQIGHTRRTRMRTRQIQMVRLISSSTRISDSIRTSRHVRFRVPRAARFPPECKDETLVQQPSS